jgi:hypothetical protein
MQISCQIWTKIVAKFPLAHPCNTNEGKIASFLFVIVQFNSLRDVNPMLNNFQEIITREKKKLVMLKKADVIIYFLLFTHQKR